MTVLFPLLYLKLENAFGRYIIRRDIVPLFLLIGLLAGPFLFFGQANYFHKDGFVDKVSSFLAVLTGFYVAALIAVATLSSKFADLDLPITDGEVRLPSKDGEAGELLSRRQYVCYMFGYMAFVSLFLSLACIALVVLSPLLADEGFSIWSVRIAHSWVRGTGILILTIPLASLALTTVRGLYYLVERLYAETSKIDHSRKPAEFES